MGMNDVAVVSGARLSDLPLQSEQTNAIYPALLKALKVIGKVAKNATNPDVGSTYADFSACMDACQGPLMDEGVLIVFDTKSHPLERFQEVRCKLVHAESTQFISTTLACSTDMDPQNVGSATTYLKRYALSALAGLKTEDDDGNAATKSVKGRVGTDHNGKPSKPAITSTPKPASENQRKLIADLAKGKGVAVPDEVLADSKKASAFIDQLKAIETPVTITEVPVERIGEPEAPAAEEVKAEAAPATAEAAKPEAAAAVATPEALPELKDPSKSYLALAAKWKLPAKSENDANSRASYVKSQDAAGRFKEGEVQRLLANCCTYTG